MWKRGSIGQVQRGNRAELQMTVHRLEFFLLKSRRENNRCVRDGARRGNCDDMIKIK